MPTRIFATADVIDNARAAARLWTTDHHQTVFYDGAGRWAVGWLGEIEEDLAAFMEPEDWEWLEVDETWYRDQSQ